MDLETDDDPTKVISRGTLLTTREKQWAESRAQMLQILGDAERAKAEARAARIEARELREHIIVSSTKSRKVSFRTIATIFTAILLSATVVKIAYVGYTSQREAPAASPVVHRTPREPVHVSTTPTPKTPAPGDLQFKLSMARLQDAFDSLPEDEPEIVREVNQKHPGGPRPCPLEWINGEAALSLDGDIEHLPPSLMEAVTQCADAVEKFRAEREWIRQAEEPGAH
jgi:hypothetical protein